MALVAYFVLVLALAGHSSATYCICKDGLSDGVMQKAIDYACGTGADCSAILQNGGCYNPNTVKDHCNYAVNSYFQRKGQSGGTCDFAGTAAPSQTAPQQTSSTCVYPSSASSGTTPTGTSTTGTTPTGTSTTTGTNPSVFNTPTSLGPTGFDPNDGIALYPTNNLVLSMALSVWLLMSLF